jgi:5S rRNA maturation endonuclease (ribonuclease M5)
VNAYERLIAALQDAGKVVNEHTDRAVAHCPVHDDRNPSLSVSPIEGSVLLHCHAGCQTEDVLAALGLTARDLYDSSRGARYRYPGGRVVHRTPDKRFHQTGNTKDRTLFRADRVGDATTAFVVEGEKDVLAVEAAGGVAVCSAMGAGKADKFDWSPLRGKTVVVVADGDEPGRAHAQQVATQLEGIAASVRVVEAGRGADNDVRAALACLPGDLWRPVGEGEYRFGHGESSLGRREAQRRLPFQPVGFLCARAGLINGRYQRA